MPVTGLRDQLPGARAAARPNWPISASMSESAQLCQVTVASAHAMTAGRGTRPVQPADNSAGQPTIEYSSGTGWNYRYFQCRKSDRWASVGLLAHPLRSVGV